jgi:carbamoylphosphate synthase large subunit
LSSNSLVNDGKNMRLAAAELASRFTPQGVAEDAAQSGGLTVSSERRMNRDPHILLATTGQLPSTARLAMELHDAGARVSLIGPNNHPGRALDFLSHRSIYRALAPQRCLEAALRRLRPDMVIPCDERTVRDLHAIWRSTRHRYVKELIGQSTAPAESFSIITSRAALLSLAEHEGVRVPPSMPLSDAEALDRWAGKNAAPFVLKADGSWAGFGVRIISNAATAREVYARMTQPVSGRLAVRESLLEGNHFEIRCWLRRERPSMSVQGYVDGWPANVGVACWQGEVLAAVCAESVSTTSATGPSTVARIIHNDEMIDAAKRVVRALGLSGMIGFDFMIEAATGAAYLIEMNPRNTPICAIRLGPGRDLAEALVARISGRPVRERPPRTERDIVVFFPDTWRDDPANHFLRGGYHDVPWEQPNLVRILMMPERRERYGVFRMLRPIWQALNAGRDASR